jgi:hypothetical protein
VKTATRNRPDPAPPSTDGDHIARTAVQVRARNGVHALSGRWYSADTGHVYQTVCGKELYNVRGAVLTTYPVDCRDCAEWPSRG